VQRKNSKRIPLIKQEGALKSYFPGSQIHRRGDKEIRWIHTVKPSPLSASYKLLLHDSKSEGASVFVISPKSLPLAKGKDCLPHVYSHKKQHLCLHYPKKNEWDNSMYYVKSLIPWACEWLLHYEIWVGTGEWTGGGIDHDVAGTDS